MITRVIHFGPDECHRMMVLRSAGYAVEECGSLMQLLAVLASAAGVEAVVMSDTDGIPPRQAAAVVRDHSSLPVILFRNTNRAYEESGFDLVVDCLTPPETWLNDLNMIIERSRTELRT
jgi:hypothetical protein